MALPKEFLAAGFGPSVTGRKEVKLSNGHTLKPLLMWSEGETDCGKTEFILSCPGPGIMLAVDRSFDGCLDNPNPPASRQRDNWAIKVYEVPLSTTLVQKDYGPYYVAIRDGLYKALAIEKAVSVALDGDSDFWELQRLTDFGKLANVWPQTKYGDTYAAKRAQIARAWDSGKVVIFTNKLRDEREKVYKEDGSVEMESDGKTEKTRLTGKKIRQGFYDTDYLFQIGIRHLHRPASTQTLTFKGERKEIKVAPAWGLRILKAKPNPAVVGTELWGDQCNFKGLVQTIFPTTPLAVWGF